MYMWMSYTHISGLMVWLMFLIGLRVEAFMAHRHLHDNWRIHFFFPFMANNILSLSFTTAAVIFCTNICTSLYNVACVWLLIKLFHQISWAPNYSCESSLFKGLWNISPLRRTVIVLSETFWPQCNAYLNTCLSVTEFQQHTSSVGVSLTCCS